jgi:hypothetical protein
MDLTRRLEPDLLRRSMTDVNGPCHNLVTHPLLNRVQALPICVESLRMVVHHLDITHMRMGLEYRNIVCLSMADLNLVNYSSILAAQHLHHLNLKEDLLRLAHHSRNGHNKVNHSTTQARSSTINNHQLNIHLIYSINDPYLIPVGRLQVGNRVDSVYHQALSSLNSLILMLICSGKCRIHLRIDHHSHTHLSNNHHISSIPSMACRLADHNLNNITNKDHHSNARLLNNNTNSSLDSRTRLSRVMDLRQMG